MRKLVASINESKHQAEYPKFLWSTRDMTRPTKVIDHLGEILIAHVRSLHLLPSAY